MDDQSGAFHDLSRHIPDELIAEIFQAWAKALAALSFRGPANVDRIGRQEECRT